MVWHRNQLENAILNLFGRLLAGSWIKLKSLLVIVWSGLKGDRAN